MLKQRDIYMIYFGPGRKHEYKNVRPGVVVMADDTLKNANVISCVPLTSNIQNVIADEDWNVLSNKLKCVFGI